MLTEQQKKMLIQLAKDRIAHFGVDVANVLNNYEYDILNLAYENIIDELNHVTPLEVYQKKKNERKKEKQVSTDVQVVSTEQDWHAMLAQKIEEKQGKPSKNYGFEKEICTVLLAYPLGALLRQIRDGMLNIKDFSLLPSTKQVGFIDSRLRLLMKWKIVERRLEDKKWVYLLHRGTKTDAIKTESE